jgi:hypothetical protein
MTTQVIDQVMKDNENNDDLSEARAAYTRLLSEIDAVPEEMLVPVTIDVMTAVTTAYGVAKHLGPFVDVAKKLPDFDPTSFTKIRDYALALSRAQTLHLNATAPPETLSERVQEAMAAREFLLNDARSLAQHGLVEPSRVADIARLLGHRGVAFDVARLVDVFSENWKAIQGKTVVTYERLKTYETLSQQLLDDVGERTVAPAAPSMTSERRQRAFTLFVNTYDQVRRAVTFLRWEQGDVDQIAPSLYAGRGNGNHRAPPPEPAPAPTPVPQVAPVATAPVAHAAPGLPGSSPFLG